MRFVLLCCLSVSCVTGAHAATSVIPFQPDISGQTVQCDSFRHDADGGWTTLHTVAIQRENAFTKIAADTTFHAGGPKTVGIDVGAVLDAVCRR